MHFVHSARQTTSTAEGTCSEGPATMWFNIDIRKRKLGYGISILTGVKLIIDGIMLGGAHLKDDNQIVRLKLTIRGIDADHNESAHIVIRPYAHASYTLNLADMVYFPGEVQSMQPAVDTSAEKVRARNRIVSYTEEHITAVKQLAAQIRPLLTYGYELHIVCVFPQPIRGKKRIHCTKDPDVDNILRFYIALLRDTVRLPILVPESKLAVYKHYTATEGLGELLGTKDVDPGVYICVSDT